MTHVGLCFHRNSATFQNPMKLFLGNLHLRSGCVAPWNRGAGRLKIRFVPYPISTATCTFSKLRMRIGIGSRCWTRVRLVRVRHEISTVSQH